MTRHGEQPPVLQQAALCFDHTLFILIYYYMRYLHVRVVIASSLLLEDDSLYYFSLTSSSWPGFILMPQQCIASVCAYGHGSNNNQPRNQLPCLPNGSSRSGLLNKYINNIILIWIADQEQRSVHSKPAKNNVVSTPTDPVLVSDDATLSKISTTSRHKRLGQMV